MKNLPVGKIPKSKFIIGTSCDDINTYSLMRIDGNHSAIILSKRIIDKIEFEEEVKNLAKYFKAVRIEDEL